jgi:hypothetical protein
VYCLNLVCCVCVDVIMKLSLDVSVGDAVGIAANRAVTSIPTSALRRSKRACWWITFKHNHTVMTMRVDLAGPIHSLLARLGVGPLGQPSGRRSRPLLCNMAEPGGALVVLSGGLARSTWTRFLGTLYRRWTELRERYDGLHASEALEHWHRSW